MRAAEELFGLLESDPVLKSSAFQGLPDQIKTLLVSTNVLKDPLKSAIEKNYSLMESLIVQLTVMLKDFYIKESLILLEGKLTPEDEPTDQDLNDILSISNGIMSFMLTLGMPLAECYLLYTRILMGKSLPDFSSRYVSWKEKILSPEQKYTVTLIIENDKLHDMLLADSPPVQFNGCTYTPFTKLQGKKATRIEIQTSGMSVLTARMRADVILMESLDVMACMIGNSVVNIHNKFDATDESGNTITILGFDNAINVNQDRLTVREFSHFINSMRKLYSNSSELSVKKISSAFHFFKNGVGSHSKESRFTSFWSALESLTLGVSTRENIRHDEHIIYAVVPCMGMDYVLKQMVAIRGIIRYLNLHICDDNGARINFSTTDLAEIYLNIKKERIRTELLSALEPYLYARFMLKKLILVCTNPREMGKKIIRHSNKVTLHIHRLYLLRNGIVHNAESHTDIDILTANLEHYLRGAINAMFYTAYALPKVRSPEEAFVRYHFVYNNLVKELEPTFGLSSSLSKSIENEILNGGTTPSDSKVIEWLKLHV